MSDALAARAPVRSSNPLAVLGTQEGLLLIDAGRPELVLVVVATLLLLSLLCAGGAHVGFRRAAVPAAAE